MQPADTVTRGSPAHDGVQPPDTAQLHSPGACFGSQAGMASLAPYSSFRAGVHSRDNCMQASSCMPRSLKHWMMPWISLRMLLGQVQPA